MDRLRKRRLHPNEFAREAFERNLKALEWMEAAERISKTKVRLAKPAADLVREDRDSH